MYRALRRALFLVAPERIHTWVFAFLRAVTAVLPVRRVLARWLAPHDPVLASTVFGVRFAGPLGLAAGFDKDGRGLNTWGALGFGYAEVGTVTAQAQPGNPPPRMFRLPDDRALLNRMGFNNHGAGELALRLARRTTGRADRGQHRQDQGHAARGRGRRLRRKRPAGRAAGRVPGGQRQLTEHTGTARPAGRRVAAAHPGRGEGARRRHRCWSRSRPDLSDDDVDEIADLAVELGLAGIVATNTTVSRAGLATPGAEALGAGGVSGPPVAQRSAEVLRRLYKRVGDRLVLISVGGIETADDAWDRITSGASLLQGYTGFIYGGGLWAKHIHDGLARRLHEGGFASLADAVGSAIEREQT